MKHAKLVSLLLAGVSVVGYVQAHADQTDASASAPEVIADARCVIVGLGMGSVRGVTLQTAGIMIAMYYLGRLDARSPKPDLEALLGGEAEKITPDDLKSEAVRCGSEFKERGNQLSAMGQHLVERANKQGLEKKQQKE